MSKVNNVDDLKHDLAGTHKPIATARDVDAELIAADWAHLQTHGYVILEKLLPADICDGLKQTLLPLLSHKGRNQFEGHETQRLYSVLAKTRACDRLIDHPRILALLDRLFMPNYLLSQAQVINIHPGETKQHLHADDSFYPVPRPRAPFGAATVWAIDDFTAQNGATILIPGSEKWGERAPTDSDPRRQAVMPKGSVIFYGGTLWHGGGANQSQAPRLGFTAQYCEPWCRTQENFSLSVAKDIAKNLSPELQSMLGYSVTPPFIGMVNGMHPKRVLED